jgi:hypothetical protein
MIPKKAIKGTVGLAVIVGLIIVGLHHTAIANWWYLRSYSPPPQIKQLATEADMTKAGQDIFYRAAPQVVTQRADMTSHCSIDDNQVAELGCYVSNDHIYLLSITEPALSNEMIVTAAYEMLHPVYEHMSTDERNTVDAEMEAIAPTITDQTILDQIRIYAQSEPGARDNELYSILGTEYPNLTPALEANYAQYLGNRAQVVAYHQAFEQTYDGLGIQIKALGSEIESTKAVMAQYRAEGDISHYNSLVTSVNSQVDLYNSEVAEYNRYGNDLFGAETTAGLTSNQ